MTARLSGIRECLHRQEGATLVEYTLIMALVVVAAVVSVGALTAAVLGLYALAIAAFD